MRLTEIANIQKPLVVEVKSVTKATASGSMLPQTLQYRVDLRSSYRKTVSGINACLCVAKQERLVTQPQIYAL